MSSLNCCRQVTGRPADAEAQLRRALSVKPNHAGAALNLGLLYLRQNRIDEAERALLQGTALDPSSASIDAALGSLYLKVGRATEATAALRRALEKNPTLNDARNVLLFSLNFDPELDAVAAFDAHARAGAEIVRSAGPPFVVWDNSRDADRRLKIGYVSGDFGNHPTGLFLRPVLEHHDRANFEIYCYSNSNLVVEGTRRLHCAAEHWEVVADIDDDMLAGLIRRDRIDILVDLSGHTAHNRLGVFARHPAPVQATWLGYLNTTGLPTMDYRIADRHTDPPGLTEKLHTERLYRMPNSQWCYAPVYDLPLIEAPHPERPDAIVFGSFNQYAKITDACLDLWCRILCEVPDATLVILDAPPGRTRDMLRARVAARHVDPERIVIRGRASILEYFTAIGNTDIALDTFPYNGATTTLDTLWMGVPVVALRGERGISRSSYSIMESLRMPELIAGSSEEYVRLNVALARNAGQRQELRSTLRRRLELSPLMDTAGFVRDLETAYRGMWRVWCAPSRT